MTRINDHLLVQRVDPYIVIIDESTGDEVAIDIDDMVKVYAAITSLILPPSRLEREATIDLGTQMGHPGGHYG